MYKLAGCSFRPVNSFRSYGPLFQTARFFSTAKEGAFVCSKCGREYSKWQGQCVSCHNWNSIQKVCKPESTESAFHPTAKLIKPSKIREIKPVAHSRFILRSNELNRVLGGGVVPGSLVLIGGEPGIGKSTLLLQMASDICALGKSNVLYVSGEETEDQVKMRCDRLGIDSDRLSLLHETDLDSILHYVYQHVAFPFFLLFAAFRLFRSCDRLHPDNRAPRRSLGRWIDSTSPLLHISSPGTREDAEHFRVSHRTRNENGRFGWSPNAGTLSRYGAVLRRGLWNTHANHSKREKPIWPQP